MANYKRLFKIFILLVILVVFSSSLVGLSAETKYVMKLGHSSAPVSIRHQSAEKFAEMAKELSQGRIDISTFPSSQLGSTRDMIDGLRIGTLEICIDPPSRLAVYTEESKLGDIFKMPFVIKSREHGEEVWNSSLGKELFEQLANESDIIILAMAWRGARNITSAVPIRSLSDLQGVKIRVPPYDPPLSTFKELGASPVPIDFNELYMALQQGVVDAQENPIETSYTSRFSEVCKYVTLSEHTKEFDALLMGKKYFESLPDDIQDILIVSARYASNWAGDMIEELEGDFLEKFREDGCEVIELVDIDEWNKKIEDWKWNYAPQINPWMEAIEEME